MTLSGAATHPSALVGREAEFRAAHDLLLHSDVRLLTFVGPGGVGKTRLAVEVAQHLDGHEAFPDGIYLVDLSPLRDAALVLPTVRSLVGALETDTRSPLDALVELLAGRRLLLILDNFEHVLPAAREIGRLLAAVPDMKVVATSREPLRLSLERQVPVGPLALPALDTTNPAELEKAPSVALFAERARATRPNFRLTQDNASLVARLVVRLDGLPLALELMAARAAQLGVATVLDRLERRLPLPVAGARDAPGRHQSLSEAIGWSYELLTPAEQSLFRRLAPFASSLTLEAAEAVLGGEEGLDVLAGLMSLADKSLIEPAPAEDGVSFRLLETVREYALEQLQAVGERDSAFQRHARYYGALAREAAQEIRRHDQTAWVLRLNREIDNLRVAAQWFLDNGEYEAALQFAADLGYYYWITGRLSEGRMLLARALAHADRESTAKAEALVRATTLAFSQGDPEAAHDLAARAERSARRTEDLHEFGWAKLAAGIAAWQRGDIETALAVNQEALDLAVSFGDEVLRADALFQMGVALGPSDPEAAAARLEESVAILRELGGLHGLLYVLTRLAALHLSRGNLDRARSLLQEGFEVAKPGGLPLSTCSQVLFSLTYLAARGFGSRALPLLRGLKRYRDSIGYWLTPMEQAAYDRAVAVGGAELDASAGPESMTRIEEFLAATHALFDEEGSAHAGRRPQPARASGILSPRELEVLTLVAKGMSNRRIAETLVVSENTAKFHVASLLNKLGASTRAEAISRAVALGLLAPGTS
ncbi:MAG TPA: LuxR C-terminal-related transcriptional regulator [Dehalococcoidia bacterium]|nr:LuxR C-terminal-related transcriptional regulator [Dehalococcoidia bacterium]